MKTLSKLLTALFFFAVFLSGCTIHFKAKEVELDSVSNHTYELEKIDIAKIK